MKTNFRFLSLFVLISLVLSACGAPVYQRPPEWVVAACSSSNAPESVAVGKTWLVFDVWAKCSDVLEAAGNSEKPVAQPTKSVAVQPTSVVPVPTAAAPVSQPTKASAPVGFTWTCDGKTIDIPQGGIVYENATVWRKDVATKDCRYNVVYDPFQSGVNYLPAKGWWYQPLLPGPTRENNENAIILQAGLYKYVGPECKVYHNYDGNHPFDQGKLLINRQNFEEVSIPATTNKGTESWIFVRCNPGDASGFSFALR